MEFDRDNFFIKENILAEAFGLEIVKFDELVSLLESSSDSSIQIKESLHFRYRNKTLKIRLFSQEGALAIANYLDTHGEVTETALNMVLALVEEHRISRIDASIRQTVYENCSSLILRRQRHWLSSEDVFRIFKTTSSRITEAFGSIQRSDNPMRIEEDFEYLVDICYFSFSGLEKLSIELAAKLYSKERREYCQRVPFVAPPVIEYLALTPSPSEEDIRKAMNYAKKRDKEKCQITGVIRDKYNLIKLVRHHLFDQNTYGFLAAEPDNIITISEQVSDEFHQWNGGYNKTCTIDDFIEYIELFYSGKHEVVLMLHNLKRVLQIKLSQVQRSLPESDQ